MKIIADKKRAERKFKTIGCLSIVKDIYDHLISKNMGFCFVQGVIVSREECEAVLLTA